jgi:hypothetical protein
MRSVACRDHETTYLRPPPTALVTTPYLHLVFATCMKHRNNRCLREVITGSSRTNQRETLSWHLAISGCLMSPLCCLIHTSAQSVILIHHLRLHGPETNLSQFHQEPIALYGLPIFGLWCLLGKSSTLCFMAQRQFNMSFTCCEQTISEFRANQRLCERHVP